MIGVKDWAQDRARDSYKTLCSLYGEHNAQSLMRVRGAAHPFVARLARAMGKSAAARNAVRNYRFLTSLRGGYLRLMTACHGDGAVRKLVDSSGAGHRFSAWEIDAAVRVVQVVMDSLPYDIKAELRKE